MANQLPSRVFSSSTLMAGLGLVKEETGIDKLDNVEDSDLQAELEAMQARFEN